MFAKNDLQVGSEYKRSEKNPMGLIKTSGLTLPRGKAWAQRSKKLCPGIKERSNGDSGSAALRVSILSSETNASVGLTCFPSPTISHCFPLNIPGRTVISLWDASSIMTRSNRHSGGK